MFGLLAVPPVLRSIPSPPFEKIELPRIELPSFCSGIALFGRTDPSTCTPSPPLNAMRLPRPLNNVLGFKPMMLADAAGSFGCPGPAGGVRLSLEPMCTPKPAFGNGVTPSAATPMKLPWTTFPWPPLRMSRPLPFPDMTLPAPAAEPPMVFKIPPEMTSAPRVALSPKRPLPFADRPVGPGCRWSRCGLQSRSSARV